MEGGEGRKGGVERGVRKVEGWGGDVKKEVGGSVKGVKGE